MVVHAHQKRLHAGGGADAEVGDHRHEDERDRFDQRLGDTGVAGRLESSNPAVLLSGVGSALASIVSGQDHPFAEPGAGQGGAEVGGYRVPVPGCCLP
jgi:hypothetical protein